MDLPSNLHTDLLIIAAQVIRAKLSGQSAAAPDNPAPELLQPAGAFASLHDCHTHRLRGCIGSFDTSRPMLKSVMSAAESVLDDPRFASFPVTLMELSELELEISILAPLTPAANALAFDPLSDGIYLTIAGRSGCFLPQVARETGWNKVQLLSRLCEEKLGLPAQSWKSPQAVLKTFEVLLVGPRPLIDIYRDETTSPSDPK